MLALVLEQRGPRACRGELPTSAVPAVKLPHPGAKEWCAHVSADNKLALEPEF